MALQALLPIVTITSGTPTTLSSTRVGCHTFMVQAHPSNTAPIWFGDSSVSAGGQFGIRLEAPSAGSTMPSITLGTGSGADVFNLADYYLDSVGVGQKANIFFVVT